MKTGSTKPLLLLSMTTSNYEQLTNDIIPLNSVAVRSNAEKSWKPWRKYCIIKSTVKILIVSKMEMENLLYVRNQAI